MFVIGLRVTYYVVPVDLEVAYRKTAKSCTFQMSRACLVLSMTVFGFRLIGETFYISYLRVSVIRIWCSNSLSFYIFTAPPHTAHTDTHTHTHIHIYNTLKILGKCKCVATAMHVNVCYLVHGLLGYWFWFSRRSDCFHFTCHANIYGDGVIAKTSTETRDSHQLHFNLSPQQIK